MVPRRRVGEVNGKPTQGTWAVDYTSSMIDLLLRKWKEPEPEKLREKKEKDKIRVFDRQDTGTFFQNRFI